MDFATLFWVGMGFGAIVLVLHYVTSVAEDHGPMRYERWRQAFVMWNERRAARRAAGMEPVYIPVSNTGMESGGMAPNAPLPAPAAPDMDAANAGMPHLSNKLTDTETIAVLTVQRGKDGKYRYSANAIHTLVGGDRNTVLAMIKELRAGPPPAEYRQPDGSTAPASRPITS